MKPVKNLVYAVLLGSILAVSASAGDQATPAFTGGPTPTPTPNAMVACDETLSANCDSTGSLSTETSDSLFYEALAALLSVY